MTGFLYHLRALLIRLVFHLLSLLPLPWMRLAGRLIGLLLWYAHARSRQVTEINLDVCFPQMNREDRERLARRSLVESSITAIEIAGVWLWPIPRLQRMIKRVSGEDYLRHARTESRPVIVLTPHLGNWEIMGVYLASQVPMTALYAPAKIDVMNDIMVKGRTRHGFRLAPTSASGVRQLLKALKAGEVVGILPDQVPDPESGMFAPFFGEPALTMTLVANLAARTQAIVLCCYARRLHQENGFEICFRPAQPHVNSENLQEAVTALNLSVEACVRECPEQYQWEYKRFKRRPKGLPRLY